MYVKQLAHRLVINDIPESWKSMLATVLTPNCQYGYNRFLFEGSDVHRTQMWSFFVTLMSRLKVGTPTNNKVTIPTPNNNNNNKVVIPTPNNRDVYQLASYLWKLWLPSSAVVNSEGDIRLNSVEVDFIDRLAELSGDITDTQHFYWSVDSATILVHSQVAVVCSLSDILELCISMHLLNIPTIKLLYLYGHSCTLDISQLDFSWLSRYPLQIMAISNKSSANFTTTRSNKKAAVMCLGLPSPSLAGNTQLWLIRSWFDNRDTAVPSATRLLDILNLPDDVVVDVCVTNIPATLSVVDGKVATGKVVAATNTAVKDYVSDHKLVIDYQHIMSELNRVLPWDYYTLLTLLVVARLLQISTTIASG